MRKFELKEEYSSHFDELRKNRMEQSFYKYGPARANYASGIYSGAAVHGMLCTEIPRHR